MSKFYIYFSILIAFNLIPFSVFSQPIQQNQLLISQPGDFSFSSWYSGTRNFAEVSYGVGSMQHITLQTSFNSPVINEIKLGKRFLKPIARYKLIEFNDNYLFSSYVDDNIQSINNTNKLSYEIWRFGLGYRKGFGYNFGGFGILPYYQMGLVWNKINLNLPRSDFFVLPEEDIHIINHFEDQIKFGTTNIAGVDFRISSVFGIGASYETAIIFPYHKVWKQMGSFFIETLAQTGIDFLTEGVIIKAIPEVAPVIYFILKNGLSYYLFTLKQENMNWPFNTVAPLTIEGFQFNLKITF